MEPTDFRRYEFRKIRVDLRSSVNLTKSEISSRVSKIIKPLTHAGWTADSDSEWRRLHGGLANMDPFDDLVFVLTFSRWNPSE